MNPSEVFLIGLGAYVFGAVVALVAAKVLVARPDNDISQSER